MGPNVDSLLRVENLRVEFSTPHGVVHAVRGISYTVGRGETVGIVGESGCGKSVGVMSMLRLIPQPPGRIRGGRVLFEGRDLLTLPEHEIRRVRGNDVAMVFQDPMTSLNPLLTVGLQVAEPLQVHKHIDRRSAFRRVIDLFDLVGIPSPSERVRNYPHQFSGGMRQRVMIAIGLSCTPKLLIADEPTTALDVTIQAQIVALVKRLKADFGMAVLWITHDLALLSGLADRVLVMYAGEIVEEAGVDELYARPAHPYTRALLNSIPRVDLGRTKKLDSIPGAPPDLRRALPGCPFYPRCGLRVARCEHQSPALQPLTDGHNVACWVTGPSADPVREVAP